MPKTIHPTTPGAERAAMVVLRAYKVVELDDLGRLIDDLAELWQDSGSPVTFAERAISANVRAKSRRQEMT